MTRFGIELRSEVKGRTLYGHAGVFGALAKLPGHYEEYGRTAFDAALKNQDRDIVSLWDHDTSKLLARTSSGTLRVGTDSTGLEFELDLPNTTLGRDVQELAERGDIRGASIGFIQGEIERDRTPDGSLLVRHTSMAMIRDISPVTLPAYLETDVELRHYEFERPTGRSQLIRARHRVRVRNPERGQK